MVSSSKRMELSSNINIISISKISYTAINYGYSYASVSFAPYQVTPPSPSVVYDIPLRKQPLHHDHIQLLPESKKVEKMESEKIISLDPKR